MNTRKPNPGGNTPRETEKKSARRPRRDAATHQGGSIALPAIAPSKVPRDESAASSNPTSAAVAGAAGGPMPQIPDVDEHERIARLAYELWESRGRDSGRDVEDWLEAERRIRGAEISRSGSA